MKIGNKMLSAIFQQVLISVVILKFLVLHLVVGFQKVKYDNEGWYVLSVSNTGRTRIADPYHVKAIL